jgi:metal-responsive CopG/Arc/MetJ family transcriptional regulator
MSTTQQPKMLFSVQFPKETVAKIDKLRGRWMSRNKFILKTVTEHLEEEHHQQYQMEDIDNKK